MSRRGETGPKSKRGTDGANRPWIVGLVGGIASGKSHVAREFEKLGAVVFDADRAAHEVLASDAVRDLLTQRWGRDILDRDGRPDRRKIAERVFAAPPDGPQELHFLETVTHPRVGERLAEELRRATAEGRRAVVLDVPKLLEAGMRQLCDNIVFVEAPVDVRRQRALERGRALDRGWSEAEFAAREAAQESLQEKRRLADLVIDNGGSPAATQAQVERLWRQFTG